MSLSRQILKRIVAFSIPLILSGLLQQLFNWVDALIVGNVIGESALAGVGATTSLYNLFITTIVGFTSGLSVLFAQQYGRGETSKNTQILADYSVILGIFFTVIAVLGTALAASILRLLNTPNHLFSFSKDYLTVIFAGIPFLAVYNTYSAVLRGMGNSKVPFTAVLLSSVINGILDFTFMALCGFGVWSAALATVISQIAMTVYIIAYTVKQYPILRFSLLHKHHFSESVQIGGKYVFPPVVQCSVTSVGNIFLQRFMNGFGEQTVAAITTAYRVDTVLLLPIINLSTAISTVVAQEVGAGNGKLAKKSFRIGTGLMAVMSVCLTAVIFFAGKSLLSMFGLTGESVAIGGEFFKRISVFYVIYGTAMSIKGYLEGRSDMLFSGIIGICSLLVRIACSYAFKGVFGNRIIAYAEAFAWIFMLIVFALRYFAISKNPLYKYAEKQ